MLTPRFKESNLYITRNHLLQSVVAQRRIKYDTGDYIVINIPFIISIHRNSERTPNILLVIPEKLDTVILHIISQHPTSLTSEIMEVISPNMKKLLYTQHVDKNMNVYQSLWHMSKNKK